jgi:hypothetical protein
VLHVLAQQDLLAINVLTIAVAILVVVINCLLAYLVLRLAITHAMKSHTRWIDEGKD